MRTVQRAKIYGDSKQNATTPGNVLFLLRKGPLGFKGTDKST